MKTLDAIVARFRFSALPTRRALLDYVNAPGLPEAVQGSHAALGEVLAELLCLLLPEQHRQELGELSLGLRLDLCIACGFVAVESREAYLILDSLRRDLACGCKADVAAQDVQALFQGLSTAQHDFIGDVQPLLRDGRHADVLREILAALLYETKGAYLLRVKDLLKKELARHLTQEILEGRDFRSQEEMGMEFGAVVVRRVDETFQRITRDYDI